MADAVGVVALVLGCLLVLVLVPAALVVRRLQTRLDAALDDRGLVKRDALQTDVEAGAKGGKSAAGAAQDRLAQQLTEQLAQLQETISKADSTIQGLAARVVALEQDRHTQPPLGAPAADSRRSEKPQQGAAAAEAAEAAEAARANGGASLATADGRNAASNDAGGAAPGAGSTALPAGEERGAGGGLGHWTDDDAAQLVRGGPASKGSPGSAASGEDVMLRADIGTRRLPDPPRDAARDAAALAILLAMLLHRAMHAAETESRGCAAGFGGSHAQYQLAQHSEARAPALWGPGGGQIPHFPASALSAPSAGTVMEASARPAPQEARVVTEHKAGRASPVPVLAIQSCPPALLPSRPAPRAPRPAPRG